MPKGLVRQSAMLASTVTAVLGFTACEPACVDPPEREGVSRYEGGRTNSTSTVYETSPISGPYVDFPAGRTLEIEHRLPGVPTQIHPDISFEESPFPSGFSRAAGDLAVVTCANESIIRVKNTTCQRFYLRVTAELDDFAEPPAERCE